MKTNRLALLLPVLLLTFAATACPLIPTEPIEPHYIAAERGTFDVIEPAATAYLQADDSLTAEARQDRVNQLNAWRKSIAEGEAGPNSVMKVEHLQAERKAFDQITPWYLAYIDQDPDLSDDQKESRTDTVLTWDFRLIRAERAAGLRGPPTDE